MNILNLYAGVGGNRKLWQDVNVTAVENEPKIAAVYQRLHPTDTVIVSDAHAYLLENFRRFDFIWSSPPCQRHTMMNKATRHKIKGYPDMSLYEEIILLQHFCKVPWLVENVIPYYEPLIEPTQKIGRHLFWSNFYFMAVDVPVPTRFAYRCTLQGKREMQEWLGIHFEENIYYNGNHCPAQILRNCVHPLIGGQILTAAKSFYLTTPRACD
jgi:DNA (cytosine-5)-methyltransferase 1